MTVNLAKLRVHAVSRQITTRSQISLVYNLLSICDRSSLRGLIKLSINIDLSFLLVEIFLFGADNCFEYFSLRLRWWWNSGTTWAWFKLAFSIAWLFWAPFNLLTRWSFRWWRGRCPWRFGASSWCLRFGLLNKFWFLGVYLWLTWSVFETGGLFEMFDEFFVSWVGINDSLSEWSSNSAKFLHLQYQIFEALIFRLVIKCIVNDLTYYSLWAIFVFKDQRF